MITGKKQISGTLYDYFAGDALPEGYVEISDIKESIYAANDCQKDYKWIRKFLQQKNWDNLNLDERRTISQYRASTEDNCKTQLGDTYQYWASLFGLKSKECRYIRFENAKTILFRHITVPSRYFVLGFLDTTNLVKNYTDHGIEGTDDGDPISGFFNFIESTEDFAANGLSTMTLEFINGFTMNDLKNALMECLRNGNY